MCRSTTKSEEERSFSKENDDESSSQPPSLSQKKLKKGVFYGALSIALLTLSFSLTLPHMQSRRDELGCDSMCLGSMMSARSALSLVGSAIVGRWSDRGGRKVCMLIGSLASLVGLLVAASTFSIQGMWVSLVPGSLFQQNFEVVKALFSDYHDAAAASSEDQKNSSNASDRAGSVGLVGMAAGLAFMAGPLFGSMVLQTYDQAVLAAILSVLVSFVLILQLPTVKAATKNDTKDSDSGLLDFLSVPAARTPAALLFMTIRLSMALAYHIFSTIWTASLKERFDFGPADHGRFMSFIGLTYALSQGFVAKFLLTRPFTKTNAGRVRIVMACCVLLGAGRYIAFQTSSLLAVYVMFAGIVTSLGVVNTVLTADTSHLASSDEIGGLFGILAAVESGAGMLGPVLGGALAYVDPIQAPLMAVVALYALVFGLVAWGYERFVLRRDANKVGQKNL